MAEEGDDEEDKSEEPSQKRLDEAVERGDVVKSIEVSTFFGLAAATAMVAWLSSGVGKTLATSLAALIGHVEDVPMDRAGLSAVYLELGKAVAMALGLPLLMFMVAGVVGSMVQHRIVWSLEPLMPKLSKVSPLGGLQRLLSKDSLVNLVKGLVKIFIVGTAMWMAIRPELKRLDGIVAAEPIGILEITQRLAVRLMTAVMVVMAIVAGADYLYQRQRWLHRLRMTRHEMKEEFKQQEGNPEIKQKLRQMRQARSRRRMMSAVPNATVVIANPTHFAVALTYEPGMRAPKCVAKGVDLLALRIREVAEKADVPVVENPPLARALHKSVEIDAEVPEEHYRAVAEVVGYVMKLRKQKR
ncbi:MAG: flagellar biosynthesis protein FlhB [Ancalomicrobiaceae bacterium]|nr:flagellar biosynthesis protein FlhB [Ancalomicrobiaceae bacterium]